MTARPASLACAATAPGPRSRFFDFQVAGFAARGAVVVARGPDDGWSAPVAHYRAPDGFGEALWTPRQDVTVIAWSIAGAPVICELRQARGRRSRPGSRQFTLQPAGQPNHYRCEGKVEFGQFFLPDRLLQAVAGELEAPDAPSRLLRDDLIFEDDPDLVQALELYLGRAACALEPPSRLEMETRAVLIVEQFVTRRLPPPRTAGAPAVPGADWRVRRTIEQIEDALGAEARLADLAAAVGLGPSQLSRLFRAATGTSIHRWVVRRRIERAKARLADARVSVTEIALDLGFASSQHFATTFRRQTGASPSAFRQGRRD